MPNIAINYLVNQLFINKIGYLTSVNNNLRIKTKLTVFKNSYKFVVYD